MLLASLPPTRPSSICCTPRTKATKLSEGCAGSFADVEEARHSRSPSCQPPPASPDASAAPKTASSISTDPFTPCTAGLAAAPVAGDLLSGLSAHRLLPQQGLPAALPMLPPEPSCTSWLLALCTTEEGEDAGLAGAAAGQVPTAGAAAAAAAGDTRVPMAAAAAAVAASAAA